SSSSLVCTIGGLDAQSLWLAAKRAKRLQSRPGGYRYYDTDRSVCDRRPCDMMGIDYRESRASLGLPSEESEAEKERLAKPVCIVVLSEEALQADSAEEDLEVDQTALQRDAHLQEGLRGGGPEEEEGQGGEARHQDRSGSKSCCPLLCFF
ncbi:hypothetical protein CEXT_65101, partial [Caerostris extrusa]